MINHCTFIFIYFSVKIITIHFIDSAEAMKFKSLSFVTFVCYFICYLPSGMNILASQIHPRANRTQYPITYDDIYTNSSHDYFNASTLFIVKNEIDDQDDEYLISHEYDYIDDFLNATFDMFCDLFRIENRDFTSIQNEKLVARLAMIIGTLLVGISGLAPVILLPYFPADHSKLCKLL